MLFRPWATRPFWNNWGSGHQRKTPIRDGFRGPDSRRCIGDQIFNAAMAMPRAKVNSDQFFSGHGISFSYIQGSYVEFGYTALKQSRLSWPRPLRRKAPLWNSPSTSRDYPAPGINPTTADRPVETSHPAPFCSLISIRWAQKRQSSKKEHLPSRAIFAYTVGACLAN